MTTGERMKARRKELGLSAETIAERLNVSPATIYRYENGYIEKLPVDRLVPIAEALHTTPAYLMGWDENQSQIPNAPGIIPIPKMKKVPLIGTIACGQPILAMEDATEFIAAPEDIDIDFALVCKGDSMINARIFPGDIVYIKKQPVVENGEIAAVLIGEEATLKKVYYTPGTDRIVLQACNPMYPDMVYSGEDLNQIKILGKAVWFMSKVRT